MSETGKTEIMENDSTYRSEIDTPKTASNDNKGDEINGKNEEIDDKVEIKGELSRALESRTEDSTPEQKSHQKRAPPGFYFTDKTWEMIGEKSSIWEKCPEIQKDIKSAFISPLAALSILPNPSELRLHKQKLPPPFTPTERSRSILILHSRIHSASVTSEPIWRVKKMTAGKLWSPQGLPRRFVARGRWKTS